jgi:hypothetical protein
MALTQIALGPRLPREWQLWVVENKMQNLGDERIVAIL